MTPASLLSSHYLTLTEYSPSTTTILHTVYIWISRNLSCPFIWLLSLYLAQIQFMFFNSIVSSCISHNFNCPFLEPVTFTTRATLAVLHLIITLMSFYFVCYVYISRKLNFAFIWIFLFESWANLTVLSFDCFVCILRNFSCPLITLLHSNLAQLLKVVGFIWLLRLYLSKLQLSFHLIVTFASRASKYRCPSIVIVAFTSHANSNVLLFGCYVRISRKINCSLI